MTPDLDLFEGEVITFFNSPIRSVVLDVRPNRAACILEDALVLCDPPTHVFDWASGMWLRL